MDDDEDRFANLSDDSFTCSDEGQQSGEKD